MPQDAEPHSVGPLSVQEVLDHYKSKHYSCTPEDLNSFSMQIIADYVQELDGSSKRERIVDEDGFVTVLPRKQKRAKPSAEPVFLHTTEHTASNADLYVKSKQTKKQQYKKDLEDLRSKFSQERSRIAERK